MSYYTHSGTHQPSVLDYSQDYLQPNLSNDAGLDSFFEPQEFFRKDSAKEQGKSMSLIMGNSY
jgi:hypothetical protein